jgi:Kef-type K+ transport system membrane component KefB
VSILVGALGTKVLSGFAGSLWGGLSRRDAWITGVASGAKLAVPLTATYAARDLGILDADLFSAIIVASVIIAVVVPLALAAITRRSREPAGA